MATYEIVLLRHGESTWNEKNLFCGWFDADLSEEGKDEAKRAGEAIKKAGFQFDCAHTSLLTRAKKTLETVLGVCGQTNIPVFETWRLNERFYGGLTGLNKTETAIKYGDMQVQVWRRSYDVPPPAMGENHPYYNEIVHDPRYAKGPSREEFPLTESLKMTIERTLPYWNNVIAPQIREGKKILVVAHGNSLRGIVKTLENITEEIIMQLNLPTGIPFKYDLDENLKPIGSMQFLADADVVQRAMERVASQGKAK